MYSLIFSSLTELRISILKEKDLVFLQSSPIKSKIDFRTYPIGSLDTQSDSNLRLWKPAKRTEVYRAEREQSVREEEEIFPFFETPL